MQTTHPVLRTIGSPYAGGFYAGLVRINDQLYELIAAPKSEGECKKPWGAEDDDVSDALSYNDGAANTAAMLTAGSELAQWATDLRIGGHDDWYLPSQDELEILYRNLKPTTDENSLYGRSGINLSAAVPTRPYIRELPAQTTAADFRQGGVEAFAPSWYWSSTQHAANSDCAWYQGFYDGYQLITHKSYEGRARAVRRLAI